MVKATATNTTLTTLTGWPFPYGSDVNCPGCGDVLARYVGESKFGTTYQCVECLTIYRIEPPHWKEPRLLMPGSACLRRSWRR